MIRSEYVPKIVWLIGLLILLFIRYRIEQWILQISAQTFNQLPAFWWGTIIPLIMGLYLGLLFIKGKSLSLNKSLFFCVVIPCLILIFFIPIVTTIALMASKQNGYLTVNIPLQWLFVLTDRGLLAIFTGATLLNSLFSGKNSKAVTIRSP